MAGRALRQRGVLPVVLLTVLAVLLAVLLAVPAHGLPARPASLKQLQQQPRERLIQGQAYLTRYGWLDPLQTRSGSLKTLSSELEKFQRFAGLPVTGELDNATIHKMEQPRCGNRDTEPPVTGRTRRKRYVLQGSKWRRTALTYKISNFISTGVKGQTRKAMKHAFQIWADVSALTFKEVKSSGGDEVNIDIRFVSGEHGDGDPFDGPGGTLAHAFFPLYGGDAHFDSSETYRVDSKVISNEGNRAPVDLFMVAAHEFGHSLGLSHSNDAGALMAPFYREPVPDDKIVNEDDVKAIQQLYGPNKDKPAPTPPKEEEEEEGEGDLDLCTDTNMDAMITFTAGGRRRTYAFKGEDYWQLTDLGVAKGYPKKIAEKWGGVPDNLDDALVYAPHSCSKEILFFFKGDQVWRMSDPVKVDDGYPKLISEEFKGIPANIDATFTWKRNNKIYFFKGTEYWRFDYEKAAAGKQGVRGDYPRDIAAWRGIPGNLATVNTWKNNRTYFFQGGSYYRIRDKPFRLDKGYPRDIGKWWFGCRPGQSSLQLPEPANQQRGDITVEQPDQDRGIRSIIFPAAKQHEHFHSEVVGYGEGDTQPQRSGAAALLPGPSNGPLLLVMVTLPMMMPAAQRS